MNISRFSRVLADVHGHWRVNSVTASNCRQREVAGVLSDILPKRGAEFTSFPAGKSLEGRPIPLIRFGNGPKSVLLWSQMHGDESTATLAMIDMLSFFAGGGLGKIGLADLTRRCSLYCIPILNPDGAARRMRQTATGIDMNRDARRFATPEGRFLRDVHRRIRPSFGLNLHDQEVSTVGDSSALTAIALLAPAANAQRAITPGRRRAMQVASVIVRALEPLAGGHLASYNDAFEPRAFGDMMQAWGTSTILVESGHWAGDPGKEKIRLLNFVGLLAAIRSIARGSLGKTGVEAYRSLEPNGKRAYDIIVRGAGVAHRGKVQGRVDVGFLIEKKKDGIVARVKEIGDLRAFAAVSALSGRNLRLDSRLVRVDKAFSRKRLSMLLREKIPPM